MPDHDSSSLTESVPITGEPDAEPSLWRLLGRLVLISLAVQLVWWVVIAPQFGRAELPPGSVITEAEIAPLPAPDRALLETADWQPVTLTWSACCESPYYAVRYPLPVPDAGDLGLIPAVGADNYWVFVNGIPVRNPGALSPSSYHGLRKGITRIPADILRPDGNQVVYLTARNSLYYTDVFPAFVAGYQALHDGTRWRQFVMEDWRLINVQIPLLLAIVCACLLGQARNRLFLLALATLALAWGLRNGFYVWEAFPFGEFVRRSYYAGISTALPLAWFAFAHYWADSTRGSPRWSWVLAAASAVWLVGTAWVIARLTVGDLAAIEASESFVEFFGVAATLLAAIRMLTHLLRGREERHWEAALLLLCMSTFTVEMAQYFVHDFGIKTSVNAAALFLLAFVIAIVARNVQLFESMSAFNADLNDRLRRKESEIQSTYEQLASANRQAALAKERERLLQDVHDGIGGQLTTVLALVRGSNPSPPVIEQALAESLEDLRLIIDSLDTATDRLAAALGAFRSRIDPRLAAAGIAVTWELDELPIDLRCEPEQVLQIYRILQEAVSNSLKHSGANSLTIAADAQPSAEAITAVLRIADNGSWQGRADHPSGRGLASMKRRVRALNGSLSVEGLSTGTTVTVQFPISPDRAVGTYTNR